MSLAVIWATLEQRMASQEQNGAAYGAETGNRNAVHPKPYKIHIDEAFLDMTASKVRNFRPTTSLLAEWDDEGPPTDVIVAVATYWANEYSWRAVEERINDKFAQFMTVVPGTGNYTAPIPLHFVHHRSTHEEAMPLLLLHGWPSSVLEWSKVIRPLVNRQDRPFHVVAPNIPGFGMSPAPVQKDLGPRELARAFDALMKQLGYAKYGLVTTDLGWFIGMWMVGVCESSIIGHMSDFYVSPPKEDDRVGIRESKATNGEVAYVSAYDSWYASHWGYAVIHGQKPLALAQALADSPVGFLAWYWDVNYATSGGYKYSYEQLITDAMMLWIPGPFANIRLYLEMMKV
jgi:hypothetical protein